MLMFFFMEYFLSQYEYEIVVFQAAARDLLRPEYSNGALAAVATPIVFDQVLCSGGHLKPRTFAHGSRCGKGPVHYLSNFSKGTGSLQWQYQNSSLKQSQLGASTAVSSISYAVS